MIRRTGFALQHCCCSTTVATPLLQHYSCTCVVCAAFCAPLKKVSPLLACRYGRPLHSCVLTCWNPRGKEGIGAGPDYYGNGLVVSAVHPLFYYISLVCCVYVCISSCPHILTCLHTLAPCTSSQHCTLHPTPPLFSHATGAIQAQALCSVCPGLCPLLWLL